VDNSDERDYSEERYNRRLMDQCPECGNIHKGYESCETDETDICDECGDYLEVCECDKRA